MVDETIKYLVAELVDDADAGAPERRVHVADPPLDEVYGLLVLFGERRVMAW